MTIPNEYHFEFQMTDDKELEVRQNGEVRQYIYLPSDLAMAEIAKVQAEILNIEHAYGVKVTMSEKSGNELFKAIGFIKSLNGLDI